MRCKLVIIAISAALAAPTVYAETFGGLEASRARDVNFTGAPDGGARTMESINKYSGYLGSYRPVGLRSALIVRLDATAVGMDTFDVLNHDSFGLGLGVYHGFSRANSMTFMVAERATRFDDKTRDTETYSAELGFKQKSGGGFFVRQGIGYETGKANAKSSEYNGYFIKGSLNWVLAKSSLATLGVAHNVRVYDTLTADRRTGNQATLGLVQELGKHVYLRGGVTQQENKTNAGSRYDSTVYTLGIGASM